MGDADRTLPLRNGTVEPAGERVTEAFTLLGNETRLYILLALWEEQVPLADDNTVPFSRLFARSECGDRGTFSYHLEQLTGQFITQHTARGGYELTIPGLQLVQTIISGTGVTEATLEPTEIDQPCPLCNAPTEITYREGVVFLHCTECEGMAPRKADVDGVLLGNYFPPVGLEDRTPEELHAASIAATLRRMRTLFDGLCPVCSGSVEGRLKCCADHDSTGGCGRCGRRIGAWTHFQCTVCKHYAVPDPLWLVLFHPAVVAFYEDHGISTRVDPDDFDSAKQVYRTIYNHNLDMLSTDPPRVAVSTSLGDDEIRVIFDETVSVVKVRR